MNLRIIKPLLLILTHYSLFLEANSIYDLRINHIKAPFAIDIKENSFSFKTDEDGPFKVSLFKNTDVIKSKNLELAHSHSFTFDIDLEYGTEYKYVVENTVTTSKAELLFETAIQLSPTTFIKPKNKLFSPIFKKDFNFESKEIKKGRLYITGLGLYQAYINDVRVGNFYLTPGL